MRPPFKPGDVWMIDMGLAAKVRPALVLTPEPSDVEQALVTAISHTITDHPGNPWCVPVPKSWLKPGWFNLQQIGSFPAKYFIRKLGSLSTDEFAGIRKKLAERLGI